MSDEGLTYVRLTLPPGPGESPRVEHAATPGLARKVLVESALPLLARARRMLDQAAGRTWVQAPQCAALADDIAALIGHSVTGEDPAPELEAVLRDGTPARLSWEMLDSLPADTIATLPAEVLPLPHLRDVGPLERAAQEACQDAEDRDDAYRAAVPQGRDGDDQDSGDVPCPMGPYAESRDPAPREKNVEAAGAGECDLSMVHYFGPAGTSGAAGFDSDGHPPNCPAHREPLHEWQCPSCGATTRARMADQAPGPESGESATPTRPQESPARSSALPCTGDGPCPRHGYHRLNEPGPCVSLVFDRWPGGPDGPFLDVETDDGRSIRFGTWSFRPDGLVALRVSLADVAGCAPTHTAAHGEPLHAPDPAEELRQARQALYRVLVDPKTSQLERDHADLVLREAEDRLAESREPAAPVETPEAPANRRGIVVAPMTARMTGPGSFVLEAATLPAEPASCDCGARPGREGHLLACAGWSR